ncbi:UDP-N-acetylmuramate dehydrogenase [Parachitinimonas caeni]|uniref:UDP-N-acetylenolpyruvoylglucosamine reductase n=1 Tax=Parachitinimonas caeni TaxID=3031301 RepID=A0ABT7E1U3_9NEIS|nr:UDP-N-acetylmuramate dehydrogenase [Parachitinimonas caeni]MDK2126287.1 UDP-N-acetylmuramate dehydrogenase [Parachitinimonas caeni]
MLPLHANFDLLGHNTLGIAAKAQWLAQIRHPDDLVALANQPELADLPRRVLGGGSNLVLAGDLPGLTLKVEIPGRRILGDDEHYVYVAIGGGESWHGTVEWTLQQGLSGLENLSLIPGTVGAAPVQNIGAYGVELKDVLHELTAYHLTDGSARRFSLVDCRFAYRDSVFKQDQAGQWLIGEVVLRLPKRAALHTEYGELARELAALNKPATAIDVATAVCKIRRSKLPDPAQIGNAGSFFKNPLVSQAQYSALLATFPALVGYLQPSGDYKLAAGWLIEQAGWKGRQLGPVGMYARQALVLVNHGGASGAEVMALAAAVQAAVQEKFGVMLEPEPVIWGLASQ